MLAIYAGSRPTSSPRSPIVATKTSSSSNIVHTWVPMPYPGCMCSRAFGGYLASEIRVANSADAFLEQTIASGLSSNGFYGGRV